MVNRYYIEIDDSDVMNNTVHICFKGKRVGPRVPKDTMEVAETIVSMLNNQIDSMSIAVPIQPHHHLTSIFK